MYNTLTNTQANSKDTESEIIKNQSRFTVSKLVHSNIPLKYDLIIVYFLHALIFSNNSSTSTNNITSNSNTDNRELTENYGPYNTKYIEFSVPMVHNKCCIFRMRLLSLHAIHSLCSFYLPPILPGILCCSSITFKKKNRFGLFDAARAFGLAVAAACAGSGFSYFCVRECFKIELNVL